MEKWAPILEFPNYLISDHGRVMNQKRGTILRPGPVGKGYLQYCLFHKGRGRQMLAHRLVAAAFIDPDIDGYDVDHQDNNRSNNYVGNLEIVSRSVNIQRGYDRGSKTPPGRKAVSIVETQETFESISELARSLNRTQAAASRALRNGTRIAGFHIEEVIS